MNLEPTVGPEQASPIDTATRRRAILLVDDADNTRLLTKWFLCNFGFVVDAVRSAEAALRVFDPGIHDMVITENAMPGMSGVEMAHVVKLRSGHTPVLMYTGRVPNDQSCLDGVIQRPTHLLGLKRAIESLLGAS